MPLRGILYFFFCGSSGVKLRGIEGTGCYFLGGQGFLSQHVVNSHASYRIDIRTDADFAKGKRGSYFFWGDRGVSRG